MSSAFDAGIEALSMVRMWVGLELGEAGRFAEKNDPES